MVPALKVEACMSDLQTLREGCQQLSPLEPLRGLEHCACTVIQGMHDCPKGTV